MVIGMSKAIRVASCAKCSILLVRNFTAIAGVSSCASQHQRLSTQLLKRQARNSSSSSHVAPPHIDILKDEQNRSSAREDQHVLHQEIGPTEEDTTSSALPWYLQVDKPLSVQRPLSERQKIPEIPDSSPPILEPLLKQISVELGLDDLTLLDLRDLDPPPALGANLLMIIGTARSEKHLHVSADRLCRWLRSEYKLRPEADGLLGRNELKLKMRRKNRRAKLIGSGTTDDDYDDGVRTGWVCVNVGVIDSPTTPHTGNVQDQSFIGFGRQTEGIKIVVQMLVEEKRNEIDLEKLWGGIQKRQRLAVLESADNVTDFSIEGATAEPESSSAVPVVHSEEQARTVPFTAQSLKRPSSTREFHTSTRSQIAEVVHGSSGLMDSHFLASSHGISESPQQEVVQKKIMDAITSGDFDGARQLLASSTGSRPSVSSFWRKDLIRHKLKQTLNNMDIQQALLALGKGPHDLSSTPLLSCLQVLSSEFPAEEEWSFRVWLYCFARKIGHEGYDLAGLEELFSELQLSGTFISRDMYLSTLRSALQERLSSEASKALAATILQDMHERHMPVLTADIFVALHESLSETKDEQKSDGQFVHIPKASKIACDLPTMERSPALEPVLSLMKNLHVNITDDADIIYLLAIYARNHDWPAFWELWRSIPRSGFSRSATLYAYMFQQVAETNHQKGCINVLRSWIPDMDREEPEVRLEGDVLESVKACLSVADPSFQLSMLGDQDVKSEWLTLWRRCHQLD